MPVQNNVQLTKLIARIKRLSNHIEILRSSLRGVKIADERYVAVVTIGRIINVLTATFEFSIMLEQKRDAELNTRIVRLESGNESAVRELAAIEDEILEAMLNQLAQRAERAQYESGSR